MLLASYLEFLKWWQCQYSHILISPMNPFMSESVLPMFSSRSFIVYDFTFNPFWVYFCVWCLVQFSSVQSLSRVQLFEIPWIAARQASLSITNSWSLPKLLSIELVMPSNHISSSVVPFCSCLQSLQASGSFQMSQLFASGGQSTGVSAAKLVHPMNIQDWLPLGWTGWISLLSKGPSRVFSTPQFKSISSSVLRSHMTTGKP